ncbi:MAG: hypothetical protein AAFX04_03760 [Pseudomonadota bacterium]
MAFSAALLLFFGLGAATDETAPADAETPLVPAAEMVPTEQPETDTGRQQWLEWIAEWKNNQRAMQVRIEQRVIIRIPRTSRRRLPAADLRAGQVSQDWQERKIGKCLPMNSIAGVQIGRDDQMLLYLRDRRIIRAQLEKACRARDFYSGFYLEQSNDGRLCVDRDVLQARSGSKCELTRIRQLVPKDD